MDTVLAEDIPKLMQRFPVENQTKSKNPFEDEGGDPFADVQTGPTAEEVCFLNNTKQNKTK